MRHRNTIIQKNINLIIKIFLKVLKVIVKKLLIRYIPLMQAYCLRTRLRSVASDARSLVLQWVLAEIELI